MPLDDLTLLYHRASGITHVLAMPALEIIEALGEQPMTAADLLAALGIDFDLAQGDLAALEARLAELVSAGLVIRE